jgi:hypothetical protein
VVVNKPYNSSKNFQHRREKIIYTNSLTSEDYSPIYFLNEAPNMHKISSTIAQWFRDFSTMKAQVANEVEAYFYRLSLQLYIE